MADTNLTPDEEAKLLLISDDLSIEYDGSYPSLCSGTLTIHLGDRTWVCDRVLSSGGSVSFDGSWNENVTSGEWTIYEDELPKDFPRDLVEKLEELVNSEVPHGCCGGCV